MTGGLLETLNDWDDWDRVSFHIGQALGVIPQGSWGDICLRNGDLKYVFWSNNPVGEALADIVKSLVKIGALEESPCGTRYRWSKGYSVRKAAGVFNTQVKCPSCGSAGVKSVWQGTSFPYGTDHREIPVTLNVHTCSFCCESFLTGESEEVKDRALLAYLEDNDVSQLSDSDQKMLQHLKELFPE